MQKENCLKVYFNECATSVSLLLFQWAKFEVMNIYYKVKDPLRHLFIKLELIALGKIYFINIVILNKAKVINYWRLLKNFYKNKF